ncbi:hypothetical protein JYK14_07145 [Siccirubricoccus sp. KC 17139]|uniref:Bacterial transcriptional activator domain-containing protein n=1 Tax=Siccirubricoccus soli TaxID=2899147 RepID=A0ABT1D204_9PROT|nr:BTAD domain-containing putative transcriptional regulator [Siccirubricoccus soli]MCO6415953.1 hypothetical protein [Siccirubricoccus soli]MCP2682085.1 hypothetical protein [Siccirubricoccus soli]
MDAAAAGPCLRLVLIGRMEAWSLASVQVLPRTRKARALLAVLGLALGTPVTRQRLAELLWSRRGAEQQRGSLRQALHELQESLAPVGVPLLVPTREAVMLRAGPVWVDALEAARSGPARPEALDLLTGELLADLDGLDPAFDAWLAEQRRRLREAALAQAALLLERAEGPAAAAGAARRLLGFDPVNEGAWRALIRAEGSRGDRGAALAAYENCRALLAERFGTTPSAETEALAVALRAEGVVPILAAAPPPPAPPTARGALRGARLGVPPLRVIGEVEEHLSIGLAEEITAALARFRWIFLVDSASLASAAGERGEEAAARTMGLDFLLAGTVQRAGDRVRVSLRLTDLREAAGLVWTGRFDREARDILALQDEVAAEVVARIDPEILLIEASRAIARGSVNASAYDLLLRAIPAIHRLDRDGFLRAADWLRQAEALEPDYAPAHAWHAYWHLFLVGQGWAVDEAHSMAEAERLAQRAIALDPLDAQALTISGHVRAFLHHRLEEGAALHERALALNPNLAMAWVFSGMALSYLGRHEAALTRLDRYAQLAPCHPHAFFFDAARGIPALCLGQHEAAVEVGRKATALHAGLSYPYKTYLSALGHLGLVSEAAEVKARLLAIEPDFTLEKALRRTPLRRPEDVAHYEAGLRKAGLE